MVRLVVSASVRLLSTSIIDFDTRSLPVKIRFRKSFTKSLVPPILKMVVNERKNPAMNCQCFLAVLGLTVEEGTVP